MLKLQAAVEPGTDKNENKDRCRSLAPGTSAKDTRRSCIIEQGNGAYLFVSSSTTLSAASMLLEAMYSQMPPSPGALPDGGRSRSLRRATFGTLAAQRGKSLFAVYRGQTAVAKIVIPTIQ